MTDKVKKGSRVVVIYGGRVCQGTVVGYSSGEIEPEGWRVELRIGGVHVFRTSEIVSCYR